MESYDSLIKALRWCADESICCDDFSGEKCPYYAVRGDDCNMDVVLRDAAAAIEELQADIKACRTLSKCRLQGWKESELFCEEQAKTLESVDVLNKSYLERIRKLEQQLPHWVSVEDSMPDLLQFVLVCNDDGKCVVAQYVGYQTDSLTPWRIAYTMYDTDAYYEMENGPVRYWMPIEPPKEDA